MLCLDEKLPNPYFVIKHSSEMGSRAAKSAQKDSYQNRDKLSLNVTEADEQKFRFCQNFPFLHFRFLHFRKWLRNPAILALIRFISFMRNCQFSWLLFCVKSDSGRRPRLERRRKGDFTKFATLPKNLSSSTHFNNGCQN